MFKQITVKFIEGNGEQNDYYAARVEALGITAYGLSDVESLEKLKRMFALMVDVNISEVK